MTRRGVLGAGITAATALMTGCDRDERATWADGRPADGTPVAATTTVAPYVAPLKAVLDKYLKPTTANPRHPTYAGATAVVMVGDTVTASVAVGHALRYGAGPVQLPAAKRVAMRTDSIFDLASLAKVYTSILLLQQVDKGTVDLDAPVVRYLPGFTGTGKGRITVRMLLTHTSGLPVGATVKGLPSPAARRAAVLATPLVKNATPGTVYRYSSVGLMVAAQIVERVTGTGLDAALKAGITGPLGLRGTGFTPLKWLSRNDQAARLAATDARSSRGLLRGVVHDDVANQMGGVIGSAGLFGTARDVAVIGRLLLGGGTYGGRRLLSAAIVKEMLTNQNKGLPAVDPDRPGRPSDHGLGVTLRQPWFMGALSSPGTFGHTGFTGTSLLVDPSRKLVLALLTNRAHPNWSWADPDPMRAEVATTIAKYV
ncbi:serine hydrolase domain-containing protein [Actinoplanes xinjiangensis]|uniref:CubicO group peptidase (Beta-lactamase class C family) n=1 Tax=Actinoplanes xinjiangensis TaxID=512350 RepID=A0A316EH75_9ACTN|nr:serine hydrolase domain-containing protein [Actinoplanes xinjiangensis]PWK29124.1 CubicO group peptidase (beta-lactamase class C family) [Actinoplanes xinjiangensis]